MEQEIEITQKQKAKKVICVCGPTAVGKTACTIALAKKFNGEIINCDSMQLYKYMDIGSAKPTAEERRQIPHYLVDEIDPREPFSVARFQKMAKDAIQKVFSRGKLPFLSGGTGLYLNALLYDMDFSTPPRDPAYRDRLFAFAEKNGPDALHNQLKKIDPDAAERIHPHNIKKVVRAMEAAESGQPIGNFRTDLKKTQDYTPILIGLKREREELYRRIDLRADQLMEQGLTSEVQSLLDMGLTENDISMKGIGYKEIIGFLQGKYPMEEAVRLIKRNSRHLAKRQLTWLRRYPEMKWFILSEDKEPEEQLEKIILWLQTKL